MPRHKAVTTTMLQRVIKALPIADLLKLARDRKIPLLDMNRIDVEYAVARSKGPGSLRAELVMLVNEILFREEPGQKKARPESGEVKDIGETSTERRTNDPRSVAKRS